MVSWIQSEIKNPFITPPRWVMVQWGPVSLFFIEHTFEESQDIEQFSLQTSFVSVTCEETFWEHSASEPVSYHFPSGFWLILKHIKRKGTFSPELQSCSFQRFLSRPCVFTSYSVRKEIPLHARKRVFLLYRQFLYRSPLKLMQPDSLK